LLYYFKFHLLCNLKYHKHNTCTTTYCLVNNFSKVSFFVLFHKPIYWFVEEMILVCGRKQKKKLWKGTMLIVHDLISHSQIACGFFPFSIAKATYEGASNPNMFSETKYRKSSYSTKSRTTSMKTRMVFVYIRGMERSKMSLQIDGFVVPSPNALEQTMP